ncbi:MAG: DoxX family protein [bacterium]|nr:DoxX family protein [bacterium]
MTKAQKITLFLLRISMGWLMFYAGITKVINPEWTAAGYLQTAKTLPALFAWFASPANIGWVNFVNEWGLTLLGVSLILGVFVRLSSIAGIALMALYYLPILTFPHIGTTGYIVEQHVIYALVLAFFAAIRAGQYYGLENWCGKLPICSRFPRLRAWLG